jgi:glycosyltransferase involved in cell wall biosynthesis
VTNAPAGQELEPTAVHTPVRIIHHGVADPARRIEEMIEAVESLEGRYTLDLHLVAGSQRYLDHLAQRTSRAQHSRLLEPLPMRGIVAAANDCDIGVHLLAARHLNERLALPNKLFEFIQARLAVIVGPTQEMARLVNDTGCGVVLNSFKARDLADALRALTPDQIASFKRAADHAAATLNAQRNSTIVLDLVDRALRSAPGA